MEESCVFIYVNLNGLRANRNRETGGILTVRTRVGKNPGLKKNQPSGFFFFFWVFCFFFGFLGFFCPEERVFRVFFSAHLLLGASRL
jgi:hypothetical protein